MANEVTLIGDIKTYNDQFHSGFMEGILRVSTLFNEATRGCINLTNAFQRGEMESTSFWNAIDPIQRRDRTTQAAVDTIKLTQSEQNKFKLSRRFGPVAVTDTAFKQIGDQDGQSTFGMMMGREYATSKIVNMIDTTLNAIVGALSSDVKFQNDQSLVGTIKTTEIYKTTALFGDQAALLIAMVMHSKPWHDLTLEQLADYGTTTSVAQNILVAGGGAATYNKPVLIMDSPALVVAGVPDIFNTLILRSNAATAQDPGGDILTGDTELGKENIQYIVQGEYDFWIDVDQFAWDTTTGGQNPDDAALLTGANWDYVRSDGDVKAAPGLLYLHQ